MLGADEIILELVRLLLGGLKCLAKFRRRISLRAALHLGATGQLLIQRGRDLGRRHAELLQQRLNQPLALPQQREQEMLTVDGLMTQFLREALRVLQRALGLGGESIQLHNGFD